MARRMDVITDRDLKTQGGVDRLNALMRHAATSQVNGELVEVREEIAGYERAFGFDTATMVARVRSQELDEDEVVLAWLMALKTKSYLEKRAARYS